MTTRPGNMALEQLRLCRTQTPAHLVKVVRTRRGERTLCVTDHDKALVFEGDTYLPIGLAAVPEDTRESSLRPGRSEMSGTLDSGVGFLTIADMYGELYRGAEVRIILIDWRDPRIVYGRHRRFISTVAWSGGRWNAALESRSTILQQPRGGDRPGHYFPTCDKKLGSTGPFGCKANVAIGTSFAAAGCRVLSITTQRSKVRFVASTMTTPASNDTWLREGEIEWLWAAAVESGTVTATTTTTTLTDATKSWAVNQWAGYDVRMLTAAGGIVSGTSWATIISNTANTLTFVDMTPTGYAAGANYDICPWSPNRGVSSPIIGYEYATREVEFLIPTPRDISVGDGGVWRAGCDGLVGTCKDKFNNLPNHGGDPYAPSGNQVLEVVDDI